MHSVTRQLHIGLLMLGRFKAANDLAMKQAFFLKGFDSVCPGEFHVFVGGKFVFSEKHVVGSPLLPARCPATTQTGVAASWAPRPRSNMKSLVGFKVTSFIFWICWDIFEDFKISFRENTFGCLQQLLNEINSKAAEKVAALCRLDFLHLFGYQLLCMRNPSYQRLYWV